jgi:hypothetical protein
MILLRSVWKLQFKWLFQKLSLELLLLLFFQKKKSKLILNVRSSKNIKTEKFQKALISDLIINVKYRSFWVILIRIESAWSAYQAFKLFLWSWNSLAASTTDACACSFKAIYPEQGVPVSGERCLDNQRGVSLSRLKIYSISCMSRLKTMSHWAWINNNNLSRRKSITRLCNEEMIDYLLQFYNTNLILTHCSIRNWVKYFLIQRIIERIDKTH